MLILIRLKSQKWKWLNSPALFSSRQEGRPCDFRSCQATACVPLLWSPPPGLRCQETVQGGLWHQDSSPEAIDIYQVHPRLLVSPRCDHSHLGREMILHLVCRKICGCVKNKAKTCYSEVWGSAELNLYVILEWEDQWTKMNSERTFWKKIQNGLPTKLVFAGLKKKPHNYTQSYSGTGT